LIENLSNIKNFDLTKQVLRKIDLNENKMLLK